MNILYLFGNGFDLNLGLKTSYRQFYDYYLEQESPSNNVAILKECIKEEGPLWSDLELALGQRASLRYKNVDDFQEALLDVSGCLREYIRSENLRLAPTTAAQQKMRQSLCDPMHYLNPAERRNLKSFLDRWCHETWYVNIITFNYTDSISQILATDTNSKIGSHNSGYNIIFNKLYHIHGRHDDTILVGVDNVEQIANEAFWKDVNLADIFIKPKSNREIGTLVDDDCQQLIQNANLIVIYGTSLGETDHTWKQLICNRIAGNCRIILFTHNNDENYKNLTVHQKNLIGRYKREERKKLIEADDQSILSKIDVGINTDIFDLDECVVPEQTMAIAM